MTSLTSAIRSPLPKGGHAPNWAASSMSVLSTLSPRLAVELAVHLFVSPMRLRAPEVERAVAARGEFIRFKNGLVARGFGEGPVVLLVHGWSGRGTQFHAFVDPLVAAGFKVIALDGPAHGASPGRTTNPVVFAGALLEVASELGPMAGVIAHSFGAAATTLALARGLPARKVVLVAPPADVRGVIDRFAALVGLAPALVPAFTARLTERVGRTPERVGIEASAAALDRPALLFHDADDAEVPFSEALRFERVWSGLRLVRTEGLGHRRILKTPSVIAEAVTFLAQR